MHDPWREDEKVVRMKLGETIGTGHYCGNDIVYVQNGEVLNLGLPTFFTEDERNEVIEAAKRVYLRAAKRINKAAHYVPSKAP